MAITELRKQATERCARWKQAHPNAPDSHLVVPAMFAHGDEPSPEHLARARDVANLLSLMLRNAREAE